MSDANPGTKQEPKNAPSQEPKNVPSQELQNVPSQELQNVPSQELQNVPSQEVQNILSQELQKTTQLLLKTLKVHPKKTLIRTIAQLSVENKILKHMINQEPSKDAEPSGEL